MLAPWVMEEMKNVDLNDERLNKRFLEVLSQLGGHPTASIPAACGGYAETAAAYRFFDNDKVGFETVLQPHIEATYRRMAEQAVVVLAQDTTEIDLTRPEQQVEGAGTLDGSARFGARHNQVQRQARGRALFNVWFTRRHHRPLRRPSRRWYE